MSRLIWTTLACLALSACSKSQTTAASAPTPGDPAVPAMQGKSATVPEAREIAVLAGGCFWGMEEILRAVPGVIDTQVGYSGGHSPAPSYDTVKTGRTGHAESVQVVFDPTVVSFRTLLVDWFFRMHDPTTANRQGNDVGSQYRSAIFFTSEAQAQTARQVIAEIDQAGRWPRPLVTQVVKANGFTDAEDYHQDYLQRHPGGYTCHYLRDFPAL